MRQNIVFSHAGSCSKYYYDRLSLTDMYGTFPELHETISTKAQREEDKDYFDYIYKVLEERTTEHPESLNELFVLFKIKEWFISLKCKEILSLYYLIGIQSVF